MTSTNFANTVLGEAVNAATGMLTNELNASAARIPERTFNIDGLVADVSGDTLVVNVGTRQTGRLRLRVAGPGQRAVRLEELRVAVAMVGGIRVGGRDPQHAQLWVIGQQAGEVLAVRARFQQLADGQARAVAERLSVEHERILLDPLDGHRVSRPCR